MHLLFHNNHECHQTTREWNLTGVGCELLSPAALPPVCHNNANPLICTAVGILFLPVPAWHCSPISGAGCLRKPDCTLLHGPAPRRNGPHLWDPETMCVGKKRKSVLQACLWSFIQCLLIISLCLLCLCLFYLKFYCCFLFFLLHYSCLPFFASSSPAGISWVKRATLSLFICHVLQRRWHGCFFRLKVRGRWKYWGVEEGRKCRRLSIWSE